MNVEFFEIKSPKGRLATMPRPRGGEWLEDEMISLQKQGVTDLVSLLTPEEMEELDLVQEQFHSQRWGISFHHFPITDRGLPGRMEFLAFIDSLDAVVNEKSLVVVHCRAGIGRSSIAAAALLIRQGVPALECLQRISAARGMRIPDTEEQENFILSLE